MTLTVDIKDKTQRSLEKFASENGKQVSQYAAEIIDDFIGRTAAERAESFAFMRLAETTFSEWDNDEDAIYDTL